MASFINKKTIPRSPTKVLVGMADEWVVKYQRIE